MIASLLSPTSSNPPGPGRISQLLPSVKCSTCHQPVPLAELGDHTCAPPPPVPQLPKPSMTPEAATALLPGRLQGRVASPVTPVPAASSSRLGSSPPGVQEPPQHQRLPSSSNARLKINTRGGTSPTQATFQPKSSPLARSDSDTNSLYAREPPFPINPSSSPLRTRMRTPSNAGTISNQSTPSTARPSISFNHSGQETTPTGPGPLRNGPAFPTAPTRGSQPPAPRQAVQPPRIGSPAMNGFPPPNRGIPPAGYNNGAPPGGTGGPPMGFSSRPGPPPLGAGPQNNLNLNGGPRNMGPPPPDNVVNANTAPTHADQVFVPPAERGIDTKTGGAAGMAGVGRRGFAAAARAAMFVGPGNRPLGPQTQYGRRPNAPQYLDIDAATRSTSTPPLSAGSGYSSYSPGPTSPLAQSDLNFPLQSNHNIAVTKQFQDRTPSPPGPFISTSTPALPTKPSTPAPALTMDTSSNANINAANAAISPISGRLPFFERLRGRLPGMGAPEPDGSNLPPTAADSTPAPPPKADLYASSSTPGGPAMRSRSKSRSVRRRTDQEPISPIESESEYGGLAYADSTDYEDGDNDDDFNSRRSNSIGRRRKSRTPPPPLPVPVSASAAILQRSRSKASRHMQFGSVSVRSRSRSNDRGDIRIGGSGPMSISMKSGTSGHSRENSMHSHSSYSSDNDAADLEGRNRSRANSSAAIAHALGLSQTPPSEYAKLGGPGILGRSVSGSSSNGGGGGSKSGYSRGSAQNNNGNGSGAGERSMAALLQDANTTDAEAKARFGGLPGGPAGGPLKSSASVSSKSSASASSAGKQRSFGSSVDSGRGVTSSALRRLDTAAANSHRDDFNEDDGDSVLGGMGGSKAQRSKTVQGMQSPDAAKKPIKLPTRSLTSPSPKVESYKSLAADGGVVKKERPRRPRTCLRCSKVIEDGRWVSVDGGGVLCERCWKNMYLPKCRRCNLPIEKQAVSSSDGQLKGKYHKECFNCHTCHKPFPDKTFYVYDGKPLCAYHYHEANDSLCAAARCGQPIEGPCAVSYSGDRYHPEHMTCEYPGYPECRERLKEYWEVDGRMLCERHAHYATRSSSDEEGEEQWVKSSKAMKRVTRFIDLAGAGGIGAGGSDLR